MARPINADSAKTRARVLEASIRHFGRHGFRATSLRRVAADAGLSFPTIHHHFGSKADLFAACLGVALEELRTIGVGIISTLAQPPAADRVERAVRYAFRAAHRDRDRSRFLLRTFVFEEEALVNDELREHRRNLLDHAVRALATTGETPPAMVRLRFIGFGMLVTRLAIAQTFELEALDDDAFLPGGIVEDYLIDVAKATLGLTLPISTTSLDHPNRVETS